jgi:hypothetical protein
MLLRPILWGVLVPAVVSGAVLALDWGPWRREGGRRGGDRVGAVALGGGFIAGQVGLVGVPPFPPIDATHVLVYLALVGTGLGLWLGPRPATGPLGWLLRGAASLSAPAWLLRPLLTHRFELWSGVLWIGGLAFGTLALWIALEALAKRPPGSVGFLVPLVTASGGAVALLLSGSALVAQFAGVLAAALGPATVMASLRPRASLASAAPVEAILLSALWIAGLFYVEVPAWSALLLGVAPIAASAARLLAQRKLSPGAAGALAVLAAFASTAAAVAVAYREAPEGRLY